MADNPDPVLAPLQLQQFLDEHFERSPMHVARSDRHHFEHLLRPHDIDELLTSGGLRFPDAQLSRANDPIDPADYIDTRDRLVAARVVEHHAAGATLVLSQAERRLPGLAALCRDVQRRWQWRCQANVYFGPAGAQGFGPHYDAHDVFILQVQGSKTFRFHAGGPTLPLASERFDKALHPAGAPGDSIHLNAGETLYIPRGVMHDAIADDSGASLHVTLGVFVTSALELAVAALQQAADRDPRWRHAVSLQSTASAPGKLTGVRTLLQESPTSEDLHAARAGLADAVALDALPPAPASLCAGEAEPIDAGCTLVWQSLALLGHELIAKPEPVLRLRLAGSILSLSSPFIEPTLALLAAGTLPLGAWTSLTEDERLALAKRLCAAGAAAVERA